MMTIRHPVRLRIPLSTGRRMFSRSVRRQPASGFPGWLPLSLRWKASSRGKPEAGPRGAATAHLHFLATHVRAIINRFSSVLLNQTLATGGTLAERFFHSIEKWHSPPLLRGAPVDRWIRVPVLPTGRAPETASSQVRELPASVHQREIEGSRRPTPFETRVWRRVGGERGARSPMSRQPASIALPVAPHAAVARIRRDFSPPELAERKRHKVARAGGPEGRAGTNAVEFFGKAPELIWRQAQPPKPAESHDAASPAARTAGGEPTSTTSSRTTGVAGFVPDAPSVHKPMRLSDLEASFVDRLADDVIRRVERRTRIERERRGL